LFTVLPTQVTLYVLIWKSWFYNIKTKYFLNLIAKQTRDFNIEFKRMSNDIEYCFENVRAELYTYNKCLKIWWWVYVHSTSKAVINVWKLFLPDRLAKTGQPAFIKVNIRTTDDMCTSLSWKIISYSKDNLAFYRKKTNYQ
jgi:hypothetical protein